MMGNQFNEIMQKLRAQRVRARRYTAMLLVLAMLTSLSVSWRLHQVGTAMTDDEYSLFAIYSKRPSESIKYSTWGVRRQR